MPLRYAIRMDQAIEVRQSFDSPTVYLDHWAIRRFSDDKALRLRFVNALHNTGGTLFLSHQTFAEFVGPDDPSHAAHAEQFLDEVLPNIYIAEINTEKAIRQESDPRRRGQKIPPPPDLDLLKLLALQRPTTPRAFTIAGLITEVTAHRDRLVKTFRETNQELANTINTQRHKPDFVKKARNFKATKDRARTLIVMEEILRGVILDPLVPITESDAADIQHAIISTSYCDYVLLDGKWEDMIRRMEHRIAKLELPITHARCFSERRNGLENFLLELEAEPMNCRELA